MVFNHLLVDPAARASVNSFLRMWARYTAIRAEGFDLHVQVGKIPTPFGHFTERSYTDTNPLIGFPLMYHHSSSLRANQLPADNADLLAHRGQGAPNRFTGYGGGGAAETFSGLPMVYDSCWDFGASVIGSVWRFEYLLARTTGSLSDPRTTGQDNNDGAQLAGRIGVVPFTGLQLRLSAARAPYLDEAVRGGLPAGRDLEDYEQRIFGLSAEYEWRHLAVVAEWATNTWESPHVVDGAGGMRDLRVDGLYVEARYKLAPGWSAAGRYSTLRYGSIPDGAGATTSWDWDVDRVEAGTSYWLTDGVLAKLVGQITAVDAPGRDADRLLSTLLSVRF